MRKIAICLVSLLFSVVLAASVLAEGKNLLPNGEFEEVGANNIPASWKGSGGGTVSVDKEIKYAGEYSLKVALEKQGAVYASSSPFPVKPGKLYLITLWYKADGFGGKKNAYRGAGAYSEIYFKGADGKDLPRHKTAINEGGSPFLWSLPFPYADSEWAIGTLIVKSPDEATSAYFKISLSSRNSKVLPVIRLDNIWIREYKAPAAKGKVYTYEAEKMNRLPAFSKIVVDKEAENGTAVASVVGKQKKGAMVFGPYTKDQAAGQYKVIYRLKIADNTKDIPAFTIKIFSSGFVNKMIYAADIKATEFKAADKYQEFAFEVVKPPAGSFNFAVYWSGEINSWVDNVKVVTEKVFTADDMEEFWK